MTQQQGCQKKGLFEPIPALQSLIIYNARYMHYSDNTIYCCNANCLASAFWDWTQKWRAVEGIWQCTRRSDSTSWEQTSRPQSQHHGQAAVLVPQSCCFWASPRSWVETQCILLFYIWVWLLEYAAKLYTSGRKTIQLFNLHRLVSAWTSILDFLR